MTYDDYGSDDDEPPSYLSPCSVCIHGIKHHHAYPWGTHYLPWGYIGVDLGEAVIMICPNILEGWAITAQGEACAN